jgi:hypothetical protein
MEEQLDQGYNMGKEMGNNLYNYIKENPKTTIVILIIFFCIYYLFCSCNCRNVEGFEASEKFGDASKFITEAKNSEKIELKCKLNDDTKFMILVPGNSCSLAKENNLDLGFFGLIGLDDKLNLEDTHTQKYSDYQDKLRNKEAKYAPYIDECKSQVEELDQNNIKFDDLKGKCSQIIKDNVREDSHHRYDLILKVNDKGKYNFKAFDNPQGLPESTYSTVLLSNSSNTNIASGNIGTDKGTNINFEQSKDADGNMLVRIYTSKNSNKLYLGYDESKSSCVYNDISYIPLVWVKENSDGIINFVPIFR